MLIKIWKYHIELGKNLIPMPMGAKLLTTNIQQEKIIVWAMVNPNKSLEVREILVVGTGHIIRECRYFPTYVGTVYQGSRIWHVLDLKEGKMQSNTT